MFKGIHFFIITTLIVGNAMANNSVVDRIVNQCTNPVSEGGFGGSYSTEGPTLNADGESCYRIKCTVSENASDITVAQVEAAFPEGSGGFAGGWKTHCYPAVDPNQVIIDATTGSSGSTGSTGTTGSVTVTTGTSGSTGTTGSVTIQGGGTIRVNGEVVTVGSGRWYQLCVKDNGEIRRICGGGGADYEVTYRTNSGGGNGDYRVVASGGTRFRCAYYLSDEECIGDQANIIISTSGDAYHCVDCGKAGRRGGAYGTLSGIAEIFGAVAPPLFGYLGMRSYSNAMLGSNQAWAGAAAVGFEQCQLMQSNYINTMYGYADASQGAGYFANNELPYQELQPPGCNGYGLGGFAGGMGFMGNGFGGFGNPYFAAGYSPGFLGGMAGPYGMYNPYGGIGMGMGGFPGMGGGINIGFGGGMGGYPGMGMGYPGFGGGMYGGGMGGYPGFGGGMYGGGMPGLGGGINIGIGGGMGMGGYPGFGGGMYGGGMGGPGFGGGMYGGGMGGPGFGGGFGGPGFGGGFGGPGFGGGINAGIGGGFGGGYPPYGGGAGLGGFGGGGFGNPYGGGAGGYGLVPWGNGAGSYWNGSGGWGGNGGMNWGAIAQSSQANNQAYGIDSYLQQAALQNSYQQSAYNLYSNGYAGGGMGMGGGFGGGFGGGYGYAPYSPGNLGISISGGWGMGF